MNKKIYFITLILSIVSVFSIILISTLFSYAFNLNYYDREYQKYGVYERFEKNVAINATKNMMGFLNSKNNLDTSFFNESEKSHLTDVKILFDNARLVYLLSMICFWGIQIYYFFFQKKYFMSFFSRMILVSGLFSILLPILFVVLYFTSGFDLLFSRFHQIFFIGNYSFDPAVSNMKALMPDGFFLDISVKIISVTAVKSILMIVAGYLLTKRTIKN